MAGDNPAEERRGDPDEFLSKPRWQRVLIALAGPTTNFLMAVVLTAALFVHGGEQPSYADKPVVVAGVVKDSPAQKAGIQPGDHIVSFGGVKNPTWDRVALELALSAPGHSEPVTIERNGQLITTSVAERTATIRGDRLSRRAGDRWVGRSRHARGASRFEGRRRHRRRERPEIDGAFAILRNRAAKRRKRP